MSNQLSMFEAPPPYQAHSETSRAAAASVLPDLAPLQQRVFAFIQKRGSLGATDEEIQAALSMNPSTQRPRRIELQRKGLIIIADAKRCTASGRAACVWKVV